MEELTSEMKYRISKLLGEDNYCYSFNDVRKLCNIPKNIRITEYIISLPNISVKKGKIIKYSAINEAKTEYYKTMPKVLPDAIKKSGDSIKSGLSDISDSIDALKYHTGLVSNFSFPYWFL